MYVRHLKNVLEGQTPALTKSSEILFVVFCTTSVLLLTACSDSPENSTVPNNTTSNTDAGSDADAASDMDVVPDSSMDAHEVLEPTFELTVGTGQNVFEALDSTNVLILERGPQGLQHVYVSLRAPIPEGLHLIDISITYNDRVFSAPTRVNAPFIAVPGEDFAELTGQLVVVPEPSGVLDVSATLRAQVEPRTGGFGEVEREVRIRW